jgi:hypothetical protein
MRRIFDDAVVPAEAGTFHRGICFEDPGFRRDDGLDSAIDSFNNFVPSCLRG